MIQKLLGSSWVVYLFFYSEFLQLTTPFFFSFSFFLFSPHLFLSIPHLLHLFMYQSNFTFTFIFINYKVIYLIKLTFDIKIFIIIKVNISKNSINFVPINLPVLVLAANNKSRSIFSPWGFRSHSTAKIKLTSSIHICDLSWLAINYFETFLFTGPTYDNR